MRTPLLSFSPWLPVVAIFLFNTPSLTAQCSAERTFDGSITITSQAEVSSLFNDAGQTYQCITGDLTIDGAAGAPITNISLLRDLIEVGDFTLQNLTDLDNPVLETINLRQAEGFEVKDCPSLTMILSNRLARISHFKVSGNENLTSISAGRLAPELIVDDYINIVDMPLSLTGVIEFPSLTSVRNSVRIVATNGLQVFTQGYELDFSSLIEAREFHVRNVASSIDLGDQPIKISGSFYIVSNDNLSFLRSGALEVGRIAINGNKPGFDLDIDLRKVDALAQFQDPGTSGTIMDLPNLTYIGGSLWINGFCKGTLNLPNLEYIGGDLSMNNISQLEIANIGAYEIGDDLIITANNFPDDDLLEELNFPFLSKIGGNFSIRRTAKLTTLNGFSELIAVGDVNDEINISQNKKLRTCCLLPCQVSLNGEPVFEGMPGLTIELNGEGCSNQADLFSTCSDIPEATWTINYTTPRPGDRPPGRPTTAFIPDYDNGDADYLWTLNGQIISRNRILYQQDQVLSGEYCLTITNETCSTTTHCESYDPRPDTDGPTRDGDTGSRSSNLGGKSFTDKNGTTVYPNPFTNLLTITPTAEVTIIQLLDAHGRSVSRVNASGSRIKLLTDDLPSGLYFLRGSDVNGQVVMSHKLVHQ